MMDWTEAPQPHHSLDAHEAEVWRRAYAKGWNARAESRPAPAPGEADGGSRPAFCRRCDGYGVVLPTGSRLAAVCPECNGVTSDRPERGPAAPGEAAGLDEDLDEDPAAPGEAETGEDPDSMATIQPTGWSSTSYGDDTEWPWFDDGGEAITWVAIVYHWPGEYEHWTWELVSPDCEADTYLLSGCEQQDPTPFLRDVVDRLHASAPMDLRPLTSDADSPTPPPASSGGTGRPGGPIESLPAWQRLDQAVDEWHAAPTADKLGHVMIVAACAAALRDVLAADHLVRVMDQVCAEGDCDEADALAPGEWCSHTRWMTNAEADAAGVEPLPPAPPAPVPPVPDEVCGSTGPRIGGEPERPRCGQFLGHKGLHRGFPGSGYEDVHWGGPLARDASFAAFYNPPPATPSPEGDRQ